jgi:HTH-type transcriptional regulator/antitoxin HigA
MITNEKHYRSTRRQLETMRGARLALDTDDGSLPAVVRTAHKAALDSQISELANEVELYDRLRAGEITEFEADGLQSLPDILVQARIARGMSQKDLGDHLGALPVGEP